MVQKDLRCRAEGAAGDRKVISICNKTADSFMPRLGNLLFCCKRQIKPRLTNRTI